MLSIEHAMRLVWPCQKLFVEVERLQFGDISLLETQSVNSVLQKCRRCLCGQLGSRLERLSLR